MTEHLTDVDQLPSKDVGARLAQWRREADADPLGVGETFKELLSIAERLRTALTGVSTCGTCEACRGAATRALGERTVEEINAAVDERMDRVERELAQPASRLCERCDSAIKNHECGCAKCGCTQCRLAQPPGDGRAAETTGDGQ